MSQQERNNIAKEFRGSTRLLLTVIYLLGIDIPQFNLVINYDLINKETYPSYWTLWSF